MQKELVSYFTDAKKTRLWYACSFLLLIIALALTSYVTTRLLSQTRQISTTSAIINNLEQSLSYAKDAETGVRGYFITKDSSFLQPFEGSRTKIDSMHRVLNQIIRDASQKKSLEVLEAIFDRRYQLLSEVMDTFKTHHQEINSSLIGKANEGKRIMDNLRQHVNQMQQYEQTIMDTRQQKLIAIYNTVTAINIAALIISVLLAFFAISTFTKENNARKEADRKTDEYRHRLEARVMELHGVNIELTALRSNEKFASTGRIARTIAHEVRNPLTNINLALEQLQEEAIEGGKASPMFAIARRNSQRIQQLITDLLNSTRFSELHFEAISVNNLLDGALAQAQDRINFLHLQVNKEYSTKLKKLNADGEKLKLAFLNIIINAVEAMPADSGLLTLTTYSKEDYCFIKIADNGTGMSPETMNRLFEPYFTQKEKGSGLGLTNTQNIILNHKGLLQVESEVGTGTVFTIRLPSE